MHQNIGKWIIIIGAILVVVGCVWYFYGNKLNFIGRLPGDIRIEKENFSFYFPIASMLLISLLIHVVWRIYKYMIH